MKILKKDKNTQNEEKKVSKKKFLKKMYTPIGYESNKDFVKSIFMPKEGGFLRRKVVEWGNEIKYRIKTKPYKFSSYQDWQKYMGVEGEDPKVIKKAIKRYFFTPSFLMTLMLIGAIFFCDVLWLNYFIYFMCLLFFPFSFISYRYWNWIVDHEKYVSFKQWMLNK